jgi:ribosomal protein S18 acetylase RimI-like enzyme
VIHFFKEKKLAMEIEIRSAEPDDEIAIKQLLCSLPGVWQKEWRDSAVSEALKSAGELALVATVNKEIKGFACFHDVGFRAYLSEMAIAEKYQKSGVGSLLLKRAENILSKNGCKLVVADVYPPAEEFYRKNGWVKPNAALLAKRIEVDKGYRGD